MRPELIQDVLSKCRESFLAVVFFSLFINLLMLVAPLYVLQIFDRVLSSESRETLLYLTLIAAVAFIALGVLEAVRGHVLVRLSGWIEQRLSGRVLQNSIQSALRNPGDKSAQGLRDLASCTGFLSGPAVLPILDVPWTPIFVAVLFLLHPWLGWLAVAGVFLLVALIAVSEWVTCGPLNQSAVKSMKLLGSAEASVRNADAVEAMGMMGNLLKRWNKANGEALDLKERASGRAGNIKALTRALRMFLQVAILGLGAWLVLGQELTAGGMIAGSILFGRAMAPIDQAVGSWRSAIAARESYRRLSASLVAVPLETTTFPLPKPSGQLQVENVTFSYPGDRDPSLRFVSFSLQPGESLGIVGPTAAGKSTLARLLIGNAAPLAGRVLLDGADVSKWDGGDLGPHIGYLPQDVELFDGSVHANIARMGDEESDGIVEAAQLAEVHDIVLGLKDGYETQIGERGAGLSGGQSQRIALARALYGDPKLIVLDEPNANLDQDGENALARTLMRLRERKVSTIVITHRLWILRHVDKIMLLRNGCVEIFGPRDEVLAKIARPAPVQASEGQASESITSESAAGESVEGSGHG
jgi:PrtD family type I secretion system ABC transporter